MDTMPIEEMPEERPVNVEPPAPEPTPESEGPLTLRDVLDRIEAKTNADPIVLDDGAILLARVGPCATGTPDSWQEVHEASQAGRGTTVLCTSGAEPDGYAETGEMLVVVLDDAGTTATQVATDGSTSRPFVAPPGMLCRDYLAAFYPDGGYSEALAYTELLIVQHPSPARACSPVATPPT